MAVAGPPAMKQVLSAKRRTTTYSRNQTETALPSFSKLIAATQTAKSLIL